MMDELRDRMLDTLLRELVGGDTPPDLSRRIMAQAFPSILRRMRLPLAAAAALILALAFWPGNREAPVDPGSILASRGSTIVTDAEPVQFTLGGYCYLDMAPHSELDIGGRELKEEVFLKRGRVTCRVDSGVGAFTVRTAAGEVRVKGTHFSVVVSDEPFEAGGVMMFRKKMFVKVFAGVVLVAGASGQFFIVSADDKVAETVGDEAGVAQAILADATPAAMKQFEGTLTGKVVAVSTGKAAFEPVAVLLKVEGVKQTVDENNDAFIIVPQKLIIGKTLALQLPVIVLNREELKGGADEMPKIMERVKAAVERQKQIKFDAKLAKQALANGKSVEVIIRGVEVEVALPPAAADDSGTPDADGPAGNNGKVADTTAKPATKKVIRLEIVRLTILESRKEEGHPSGDRQSEAP
jgi:FecR protein